MGQFSVKSAYKIIRIQQLSSSHSQSSNHLQSNYIWKSIWAVKVCNKIKTFIWRACRNILPTKLSLTQRKILCDVGCDFCEYGEELIDHVLLCSPYAKQVWNFIGLRNTLSQSLNLSFVDVVNQMVTRLKDPMITICFTTSWMIWSEHNEAYQGTSWLDLAFLAKTATAHAIEYLEANFASLRK